MIDGKFIYCVDLHGLHIREAREVINEFVLPFLKQVEQMMIKTGRGIHSNIGKSILKDTIKEYFNDFNTRYESVNGNDGALYIFSV